MDKSGKETKKRVGEEEALCDALATTGSIPAVPPVISALSLPTSAPDLLP